MRRCAEATGDERYRRLAGLAAAWFFGDNPARNTDVRPGDGPRRSTASTGPSELRVNRNSGAESTIEALLALLAVADDPVASRYFTARTVGTRRIAA